MSSILTTQGDATAPQFLEQLVRQAEWLGASDVHLQMAGDHANICFRLDGVLVPAAEISGDLAERVFGRIKFLARLKTYQDSLPQDGRIAKSDIAAKADIRVATYPTITGEKIVLRFFNEGVTLRLDELHLDEQAVAQLKNVLQQSGGLVLLTGPAGSGKTTTIYSALRYLVELGGRHIITIEDPVEQVLPGVMQTEINEARGLTYATAARHLLRQDPQVLVLGEIRDDETAQQAVRAALTGHIVISTLHAGSCKGVFERLSLMCRDTYAVISSVELVINQRLIRKLCEGCKGKGCDHCAKTGFRGRVPVVEWVRLNSSLREKLRMAGPESISPEKTLDTAGAELCQQGVTTADELARVFGAKIQS